jgi:DNA-binding winged helix-turn-helix (wHTH) protein/predicted ATPase
MKYFLSYRFDPSRGALWRGTRQIEITRKAADVLACLVEADGELVSHEEILARVWPDTHVQPQNIKVLVSELRRALTDDARDPQFIRSEPSRGYAFLAPISDTALPTAGGDRQPVSSIFVNHRADLARLGEILAGAQTSDCRLVLVEGERGTGKTALCDAFVQQAGRLPSVRICYGQCLEHAGPSEPYFPVLDALHHLARQSPSTIPKLLANVAPAWLSQLPPWVADAASPPSTEATPDSSRLILELSALFETLATDATTVIVLEDLHWGDLATIELLRGLARRHTPLRTLIVATYTRHTTTVTGAALRSLATELRGSTRCATIATHPLSMEDVHAYLIARFGPGRVETLARTLHRVTGGIPLSVVAVTDGLIEADYLTLTDNTWRLRYSPRMIEKSLPKRLLDVVLWRFEQLGPEDRAVLEIAAAVGTEFTAADVARAADIDTPFAVRRRLETLADRGFIGWRDPLDATDTAVFRFLHPMHADVLNENAPPLRQIQAARRLALPKRSRERFG